MALQLREHTKNPAVVHIHPANSLQLVEYEKAPFGFGYLKLKQQGFVYLGSQRTDCKDLNVPGKW